MSQEEQWTQEWGGQAAEPVQSLEAMDALITELRAARDDYEDKKEASSKAHAIYKQLEDRVIKALQTNNRSKYEVEGIAAVHIVSKESYTTPKTNESKMQLFEYIKQKYGQDALTGLTSINSQTLNAFANKESDLGVMVIPGLEAPTVQESLSVRRK
jgi:hypothetical protein